MHEGLFDLEHETKLPVRLAFAGLWCVADREGRFVWRPRTLKAAIMPHDAIDFGDVLDALERGHFVTRYDVDGVEYGVVNTFKTHQVVNSREAASAIPAPPASACTEVHMQTHAQANGTHVHARGEGKGREGELEGKGSSSSSRAIPLRVPGATARGTAPAAAAAAAASSSNGTNGEAQRVTSEDVARAWAETVAKPGANPKAKHSFDSWRAKFETIAEACNEQDGNPTIALHAVIEWFWFAPDGPVQSKRRMTHATATPGHLAQFCSRDLDAARVWWFKQCESRPLEATQ